MAEDDDRERESSQTKQLLSASGNALLVGTAAAAATSLVTGVPPSTALLAGGVAGVAASIREIVQFIGKWATSQTEASCVLWWAHVSSSYGDSDLDEIIHGRLEDPAVRATILQSLKTLRDVVDPCVIPALGVLTARYLPKKKPDNFFRQLSRLLCDITTADDFLALQNLMGGISVTDVPDEVLEVIEGNFSSGSGMYIYVQSGDHRGMYFVGAAPDVSYLFHILKSNGFGTDASGGLLGPHPTGSSIVLAKSTAAMIHAVINPQNREFRSSPAEPTMGHHTKG